MNSRRLVPLMAALGCQDPHIGYIETSPTDSCDALLECYETADTPDVVPMEGLPESFQEWLADMEQSLMDDMIAANPEHYPEGFDVETSCFYYDDLYALVDSCEEELSVTDSDCHALPLNTTGADMALVTLGQRAVEEGLGCAPDKYLDWAVSTANYFDGACVSVGYYEDPYTMMADGCSD